MKIFNYSTKKTEGKNFFDLPAKEKKKIIDNATKGSNELQEELSIKYDKLVLNKAF